MGELHEALDTLREENCICESLYLLGAGNLQMGCFIGVFDGRKEPPNMERAINKEHFRYFDAALSPTKGPLPAFNRLECIYHLDRSRPVPTAETP